MNGLRGAWRPVRPLFGCGVIWGAAEATLGHLLHWAPVPGLAGAALIPLGLWAMTRAVREAGAPCAAFGIAAVAAAVKMIDLPLPGRGLSMTLRPVLAILTEGLILWAFFALAARFAPPRPARERS